MTTTPAAPPRGRWILLAALVAVLLLVLTTVIVVLVGRDKEPPLPPLPLDAEPGELIATRDWAGVTDDFDAWQLAYATADVDGEVREATGLVVAAKGWSLGPRPVLVWAHGTTGVAEDCAPSARIDAFGVYAGLLAQMVLQGWVVVAPDFAGLGSEGPHEYLGGLAAGRDLVHAVTASQSIDGLALMPHTVIWGGSQGAHAALWAGVVADEAPSMDLRGIAAMAPPTEVDTVMASIDVDPDESPFGRMLISFLLQSWHDVHPEAGLLDHLPESDRDLVGRVAAQCQGPESNAPSLIRQFSGPLLPEDSTAGRWGELMRANSPNEVVEAPILLAQGDADDVVPVEIQRRWAERMCAEGQVLEYREYEGLNHLSLLTDTSPLLADLLIWTAARFEGDEPVSTCE
ncbi:lipase family protein [Nocardioides limicola]|uniref:lipase family protein n=1 Tax=Nocardioides limicola TaxID=2803368 RepID=UPI00193BBB1A|nr:lipase family protein [Nocardioides sp. DJM-14]